MPPAAADCNMEHLIESVRKYPCLWNTTAIEYRDQELKDAAWAEVMKETDLASVKEVKLKWKKLRDSYRDALKRQGELAAREPGAGGKKLYPWKYMGLMQFLQPHMGARKRPEPPAPEPTPAALNGHAHQHAQHARSQASARSTSSSDSEASAARSDAAPSSPPPAPAPAKRRSLAHIDRKLAFLCKQRRRSPVDYGPLPAHAAHPALTAQAQPDPLDIFFNSMCQASKRLPFVTQIKIKRTLFEAVTAGEEALLAQQASYAELWGGGARGGGGGGSSTSSEEAADAPDPDDRKPAL